jgi:hypothetical protein
MNETQFGHKPDRPLVGSVLTNRNSEIRAVIRISVAKLRLLVSTLQEIQGVHHHNRGRPRKMESC